MTMKKAISDRPWIWIVLGYLAMVAVMIAALVIAIKHAPAEIAVPHTQHAP